MKLKLIYLVLVLMLCPLFLFPAEYVIDLGSLKKESAEMLASAYAKNLEPFYPVYIEDFKDLYLLSGPGAERVKKTLALYEDISIDRIIRYSFQSRFIPDDPYVGQQYSLNLSKFFQAWDITVGDDDIVVGLVDSGIDYNHPDLQARIWTNTDEIPGNGIDDDNNGFIDDVIGWNFVSASPDELYPGEIPGPCNNPADFSGHGTCLCGIIGAVTNNGIGIAGASHKSRIMAVKSGFVDSEGAGILLDADAARGIVYAVNNGAHIINLSWGDTVESNIIRKAVNYALRNNVIVISAAGNSGGKYLFFPSSMQGVISVGSVAQNGNRSGFSNYSREMDIYMYGENIRSTGIGGTYGQMTGTSMSCAYITGAMVLLKDRFPGFSSGMLRGQLISTASDIGVFHGSPNSGILDMHRALVTMPQSNIVLSSYQFFKTSDPNGVILPGDDVSLAVVLKNLWRASGSLLGQITRKDPDIFLYSDSVNIDPMPNFGNYDNYDEPVLLNFSSNFYYGKRGNLRLEITDSQSSYTNSFILNFVMPYPENQGFPFLSGDAVVSSPLAVDTDGDGYTEIFWGSYSGDFFGVDHQGNMLDGFPIHSKAPFVSSPAYADLENNGNYYIIFGGMDRRLYAIDSSGAHKPGFPVILNGSVYGCTPVGMIDGDGTRYIIASTLNGKLYAIDPQGNIKNGFPVDIPMVNYSSPALADLDGDNTLSIIVGGSDGGLYIFSSNGTPRPNFPYFSQNYVFSSPAAADIDDDGSMDIVFASYDSKIYALDRFGALKTGFPVNLGGPVFSSPALQDINQDGYLNIIIGSGNPANKLWAIDHLGAVLDGFPVESSHAFSSSPSLYDIDSDGYPDIAAGCYDTEIYLVNYQAEAFLGFPYPLGAEILCSPTFSDTDNDGDIDLITGTHSGMIHILDLQFPSSGPVDAHWFTFRGNYQRTGSR